MEKATTEALSNAADQSDAHTPAPKTDETAEEPLIELHQDQQLTESVNEATQPCDPAPIVEEPNESQIDAVFQEPQSTISVTRCPATQVI